jgi:hypothetical protein
MQMVQNGDDSVTWSIEPSRAPDRDKDSIALGLDAGPRLNQLIVWDTGETELDLADLDAGTQTPQHRIIATPNDLDELLSQQLARQTTSPSSATPETAARRSTRSTGTAPTSC